MASNGIGIGHLLQKYKVQNKVWVGVWMLLCFCGHLAVVYIYRIKCFYFLQRPLYKSFLKQNIYKKPELDSWRSILASMALALLATLFKGEKGAALSANKQSNNKHLWLGQGCIYKWQKKIWNWIESEISMALALWPPCSRGEEQGALCKQTVKSNNKQKEQTLYD